MITRRTGQPSHQARISPVTQVCSHIPFRAASDSRTVPPLSCTAVTPVRFTAALADLIWVGKHGCAHEDLMLLLLLRKCHGPIHSEAWIMLGSARNMTKNPDAVLLSESMRIQSFKSITLRFALGLTMSGLYVWHQELWKDKHREQSMDMLFA